MGKFSGNLALLERYVHHGITAPVLPHSRPRQCARDTAAQPLCRVPEYNNGYFSAGPFCWYRILLSEQKVEPCGLSYFEQFAVRNPVPPTFYRPCDLVT